MSKQRYYSPLSLPRMPRISRVWHGSSNGIPYERVVEDEVPTAAKARRYFRGKSGRRYFRVRSFGLKRFLKRRSGWVSALKVSWNRFYELMKESHVHYADLFVGNYLLLQVTPSPIFHYEKPLKMPNCGYTGFSHEPLCYRTYYNSIVNPSRIMTYKV